MKQPGWHEFLLSSNMSLLLSLTVPTAPDSVLGHL